jgi:hypothetical protein
MLGKFSLIGVGIFGFGLFPTETIGQVDSPEIVLVEFTGTVSSKPIDEFGTFEDIEVGDLIEGTFLYDPFDILTSALSLTVNGRTFADETALSVVFEDKLRFTGTLTDTAGNEFPSSSFWMFLNFPEGTVGPEDEPTSEDFVLENLGFTGITVRKALLGIPIAGVDENGEIILEPGYQDADGNFLTESEFGVSFDTFIVTSMPPASPDCAAIDFNGDGVIDEADLDAAEDAFNEAFIEGIVPESLDFNGDGALTMEDVEIIVDDFFEACEGAVVTDVEPTQRMMRMSFVMSSMAQAMRAQPDVIVQRDLIVDERKAPSRSKTSSSAPADASAGSGAGR